MKGKIKKTVIITGYSCNNKCQFCLDEDKRVQFQDKNTAQIKQEIVNAKTGGTTFLEFIGGEVFIRPDIVDIISFASNIGFDNISVATNGRMLSYEKLAYKVCQAGLTEIIFSIHGHNEKLHDELTRVPGSFQQLLQGVNNIKRYLKTQKISSNTTICKQNYKYIEEVGREIYDLGIRNSEFIFVDPTIGAPFNNFFKYVPKISKAAPYIHKCLEIGKREKIPHWHIRYVPLCYFQDYLDQISELQEVSTFHSEHLAPDFQNMNAEQGRQNLARQKTERCQGCKLYNICEGLWKEYIKNYSDKELIPISDKK